MRTGGTSSSKSGSSGSCNSSNSSSNSSCDPFRSCPCRCRNPRRHRRSRRPWRNPTWLPRPTSARTTRRRCRGSPTTYCMARRARRSPRRRRWVMRSTGGRCSRRQLLRSRRCSGSPLVGGPLRRMPRARPAFCLRPSGAAPPRCLLARCRRSAAASCLGAAARRCPAWAPRGPPRRWPRRARCRWARSPAGSPKRASDR
mmetsp:Transcript_46477/g.124235  ORF Transcript_46477/g.124235 Transcript_46477/m.124235 type:complete len:200 (-) Transcript_46477:641-1240(-)